MKCICQSDHENDHYHLDHCGDNDIDIDTKQFSIGSVMMTLCNVPMVSNASFSFPGFDLVGATKVVMAATPYKQLEIFFVVVPRKLYR